MTDIKHLHTPYAYAPRGLLDPRPTAAPVVTAGAELDAAEARTYGGVAASRLAALCLSWIAVLAGLFGPARQRKLSDLKDGLDPALLKAAELYMSIKTALTKMHAPITVDISPNRVAPVHRPREPYGFRWDISPSDYYNWTERTEHMGYDPRGTSAEWIIRRAGNLRAQATKFTRTEIWRSLDMLPDEARRTPPRETMHQQGGAFDFTPVREFVPVEAEFDQIWPPITLTRPKLDTIFEESVPDENPVPLRRRWLETEKPSGDDAAGNAVGNAAGMDNPCTDILDIKARDAPILNE